MLNFEKCEKQLTDTHKKVARNVRHEGKVQQHGERNCNILPVLQVLNRFASNPRAWPCACRSLPLPSLELRSFSSRKAQIHFWLAKRYRGKCFRCCRLGGVWPGGGGGKGREKMKPCQWAGIKLKYAFHKLDAQHVSSAIYASQIWRVIFYTCASWGFLQLFALGFWFLRDARNLRDNSA